MYIDCNLDITSEVSAEGNTVRYDNLFSDIEFDKYLATNYQIFNKNGGCLLAYKFFEG